MTLTKLWVQPMFVAEEQRTVLDRTAMEKDDEVVCLNLTIRESHVEIDALTLIRNIRPRWHESHIVFQTFTDGITNKLIGVNDQNEPDDVVLIRIYGENTSLIIDRDKEKENFKALYKAGYAPKLYATFLNGLAYEYVPGEVLNPTTVRDPEIYPLVASLIAKFHHVNKAPGRTPILWTELEKILNLVPSRYCDEKQNIFEKYFPSGVDSLKNELEQLKEKLSSEKSDVVLCHNDLLLANIVHSNRKVTFIDYEYCGYNYQAYDIGNHFVEFPGVSNVDYSLLPDTEFQNAWIRKYLNEYKKCSGESNEATDDEVHDMYLQANKFSLVSHLFWASWALVQAHHSNIDFNFIEYAHIRMTEYYVKKDILLNLSSND